MTDVEAATARLQVAIGVCIHQREALETVQPAIEDLMAAVRAENTTALDAAEYLFAVLANVSGGDWSQQSPEWREAAARARDLYHAALDKGAKPCAFAGCDQHATKIVRLGQHDVALVCPAHGKVLEVRHVNDRVIPKQQPWSPTAGRFRSGISDG